MQVGHAGGRTADALQRCSACCWTYCMGAAQGVGHLEGRTALRNNIVFFAEMPLAPFICEGPGARYRLM